MLKSVSKKLLSGVLALAMVLTLVAVPAVDASAAAVSKNGYKLTNKTTVTAGASAVRYNVTGVKKGTKVTVLVTNGVYVGKTKTATTNGARKITLTGTGKTLKFYVKVPTTYTKTKANVKVTVAKTSSVAKTVLKDSVTVAAASTGDDTEDTTTVSYSVAATGVKQLTITTANAGSLTASDVTVKKESASIAVSSVTASDSTTLVATLGTKLTAGTYDVTVGGETASVTVTDETVSSIALVSTNLVETQSYAEGVANSSNVAYAEIQYKVLNQYGETMKGESVSASSSFGTCEVTVGTTKTNGVGTIKVTIPTATLAVEGTTGTLVLVHTSTGVQYTDTVTYSAKAVPASIDVVGTYNTKNGEYASIVEGDDASEYVLVATVYDQYGNALSATKANNGTTITPSAGTTGITLASLFTTVEIDDTSYLALTMSGTAVAGSLYYTVVSNTKGLMTSSTIEVSDATVIASMSFSASEVIYSGESVTFDYTVTDKSGNSITSYSQLKKITFTASNGRFSWIPAADGSAVLQFTATSGLSSTTVGSATFTANSGTSNVVVKTITFSIYATRTNKGASGLNSKQLVAVAAYDSTSTQTKADTTLTIKAPMVLIEDSTGAEDAYAGDKKLYAYEISGTATVGGGTTATITATEDSSLSSSVTGAYVTATSGAFTFYCSTEGTYTLRLWYDADSDTVVDSSEYTDVKIYVVNPLKATSLSIESVNASAGVEYAFDLSSAAVTGSALTNATDTVLDADFSSASYITDTNIKSGTYGLGTFEVRGKVNGKTLIIPQSQYTIQDIEPVTWAEGTATSVKSSTFTVVVDGTDSSTSIDGTYSVGVSADTLTVVADANPLVESTDYITITEATDSNYVIDNTEFIQLLDLKDQYGGTLTSDSNSAIKYTVSVLDVSAGTVGTTTTVSKSGTNSAKVTLSGTSAAASTTVDLYVTATYGNYSVSRLCTVTIAN